MSMINNVILDLLSSYYESNKKNNPDLKIKPNDISDEEEFDTQEEEDELLKNRALDNLLKRDKKTKR